MRAAILAGRPYGACENDAFSQVSLKPPARFSHCAQWGTCENRKAQFFFKFLANEKDPKHEKSY
jgi:hypothetical protein